MTKRKLICLFISVVLAVGLSGCGGKTNPTADGGVEYNTVTEVRDDDVHYVSTDKTLHIKTVTVNPDRTFVRDGISEYSVLIGTNSAQATKAASFLVQQIGDCTGAYLPIVYDTDQDLTVDDLSGTLNWGTSSKYLIVSHEALESEAGITWRTDVDLAYSGYMIRTAGNSVFMKVNTDYGYQRVVQAFLREVLGYEWFAEDTIVFHKSGETIPDMDIVEKPDFDLVYTSGNVTSSGRMASGQTDMPIFVTVGSGGQFVHNSYEYLPPETYLDSHPDWYSPEKGVDTRLDEADRNGAPLVPHQLCYTARGNKTEYEEMIETAADAAIEYIRKSDCSVLTFTQMDYPAACTCTACQAATEAFGAVSATQLMFVNDFDDAVKERMAADPALKDRKLTVLFFAYRATEDAPVSGTTKDTYTVATYHGSPYTYTYRNGSETVTETIQFPYRKTYPDGLKCNADVGVFWAAINAHYNSSFYSDDPVNVGFRTDLEKWSLITDTLYAWLYDTYFPSFLTPYNSYDSLYETLRCIKDNNADFLFLQTQGTHYGGSNLSCTAFGALKLYNCTVAAFDVNADQGAALDRFFEYYFRDAAEPMREFYEGLTSYLHILEEQYPAVFSGYEAVEGTDDSQYWPMALMNSWLDLCDEAYAAISHYKTSDPELYVTLEKHIKIETIFPRFIVCEYYSDYYTNVEAQAMRQSFYDDCKELSIEMYAEHTTLESYWVKWGVTR